MAAASASVPAAFSLGFRRLRSPKAISLLPVPAKTRQRFRLWNDLGVFRVQRGLKVCASGANPPPNPNTGQGKVGSSSSSAANGPPLATILAGAVVFLLFCWAVGSIVTWILGLIVNVPRSSK